jgi:hypothetical protein
MSNWEQMLISKRYAEHTTVRGMACPNIMES